MAISIGTHIENDEPGSESSTLNFICWRRRCESAAVTRFVQHCIVAGLRASEESKSCNGMIYIFDNLTSSIAFQKLQLRWRLPGPCLRRCTQRSLKKWCSFISKRNFRLPLTGVRRLFHPKVQTWRFVLGSGSTADSYTFDEKSEMLPVENHRWTWTLQWERKIFFFISFHEPRSATEASCVENVASCEIEMRITTDTTKVLSENRKGSLSCVFERRLRWKVIGTVSSDSSCWTLTR